MIQLIEAFTAECDACGTIYEDGDYSIHSDKDILEQGMKDEDWTFIDEPGEPGQPIVIKTYCDQCSAKKFAPVDKFPSCPLPETGGVRCD